MSTAMSTDSTPKRFEGRVFHAHCDTIPSPDEFSCRAEEKWGCFTPDIFLVISSPDLMSAIQEQLRKHLTSQYKAESATIQLGDAAGERGSEMISANLASRVLSFVSVLRARAYREWTDHGHDRIQRLEDITPTTAGIRLYPKLPEVKGDAQATKAKVRDLAIKYGAIPESEGAEPRDVSDLDVTIKANIFGDYQGKFYLNYRLVAPFRHKDKPEVLAEQPKKAPRKRAATPSGSGGDSASAVKKPRAPATKKEVNTDLYDNEDDLCMAYVKAGYPLRTAAQMALNHFKSRSGDDNTDGAIFSDENANEVSGGGAGAGSAGESTMPSFEVMSRQLK